MLRCPAPRDVAQQAEELQHHLLHVPPVGGEDRRQGAQVEQNVKKHVVRPLHPQAQQVLGNGQVAGAGDGQKFRHPLDQTEYERIQQGHVAASLQNFVFSDKKLFPDCRAGTTPRME